MSRRRSHEVAQAFGSLLRTLRIGAGLSQEELADRANIDRTYPSLLEKGKRTPTLDVVLQVARGLNMKAATLVTMTERRLGGEWRSWPWAKS